MPVDRLRVATWNCAGVPDGLSGIVTGRPHRRERFAVAPIAAALASYDVVCVQESLVPEVMAFVDRLAQALDMRVWQDRTIDDPARPVPYGSGLAILARHDLAGGGLDVRFERFAPPASGFDGWSGKGHAMTTLTLPSGARAHILDTHLQSDDPFHSPATYRAVRARQIEAISSAIGAARAREPAACVVVCGDFNVHAHSAELREILAPAMHARALHDVVDEPTLGTFVPTRNSLAARFLPYAIDSRVDYVWVGDGAEVVGAARLSLGAPAHTLLDAPMAGFPHPPSDHFALGVELHVEVR